MTTKQRTLIQVISSNVTSLQNCIVSDQLSSEWAATYRERIEHIERNVLPRGSGIDNGTKIDLDRCNPKGRQCIVFNVAFHRMDENGYYCGWQDYRVVVVPCFDGINVNVIGRDYNGLKDYLAELFHHTLQETYSYDESK